MVSSSENSSFSSSSDSDSSSAGSSSSSSTRNRSLRNNDVAAAPAAAAVAVERTTAVVYALSSTLAYNSDDEPPVPGANGEGGKLSLWRLPPEESLSDWTIEIIIDEETSLIENSSMCLNETVDEENENCCKTVPQQTSTTTTEPGKKNAKSNLKRRKAAEYFLEREQQKLKEAELTITAPTAESVAKSTQKTTTAFKKTAYHVHKCILGAGTRKCEYFTRLFRNEQFAESKNQTSTIRLKPLAAEAFPAFLDYMYLENEPVHIRTETATALHFLGLYFENRYLRWVAKKFWKADLKLKKAHIYYEHAKIFGDEKILKAVLDGCSRKFLKIDPEHCEFLQVVDAESFGDFIQTSAKFNHSNPVPFSLHASRIIATYFNLHEEQSNKNDDKSTATALFDRLTGRKLLCSIDPRAVKDFLDLQARYAVYPSPQSTIETETTTVESEHPKRRKLGHVAAAAAGNRTVAEIHSQQSTTQLTCLQLRCVDALAGEWRALARSINSEDSSNNNACSLEYIKTHHPNILGDVLTKVLLNAGSHASKFDSWGSCSCNTVVTVSGAGMTNVNGVYRHADHFPGACRFVSDGHAADQPPLSLYKWRMRWFLSSVSPATKMEGTSLDIDYYSAPVRPCSATWPSVTGWVRARKGIDPAPDLVIYSGTLELPPPPPVVADQEAAGPPPELP